MSYVATFEGGSVDGEVRAVEMASPRMRVPIARVMVKGTLPVYVGDEEYDREGFPNPELTYRYARFVPKWEQT